MKQIETKKPIENTCTSILNEQSNIAIDTCTQMELDSKQNNIHIPAVVPVPVSVSVSEPVPVSVSVSEPVPVSVSVSVPISTILNSISNVHHKTTELFSPIHIVPPSSVDEPILEAAVHVDDDSIDLSSFSIVSRSNLNNDHKPIIIPAAAATIPVPEPVPVPVPISVSVSVPSAVTVTSNVPGPVVMKLNHDVNGITNPINQPLKTNPLVEMGLKKVAYSHFGMTAEKSTNY
jgi:hypothetical protein